MKLVPGESPINLRIGQVIPVFLKCDRDSIEVPMTVLKTYENGDFDGEVIWGEA
jgi:hypothetical protein